MPVQRNDMQQAKKAAFLAAYAECGNITTASKAVGIDRITFYRWSEHDDAFAQAAQRAYLQAGDRLEEHARAWATIGVPTVKEIYERHKVKRTVEGGKDDGAEVFEDALVLVSREEARHISPTLLIFLLKGAKPEKYKERAEFTHNGPAVKALSDAAWEAV